MASASITVGRASGDVASWETIYAARLASCDGSRQCNPHLHRRRHVVRLPLRASNATTTAVWHCGSSQLAKEGRLRHGASPSPGEKCPLWPPPACYRTTNSISSSSLENGKNLFLRGDERQRTIGNILRRFTTWRGQRRTRSPGSAGGGDVEQEEGVQVALRPCCIQKGNSGGGGASVPSPANGREGDGGVGGMDDGSGVAGGKRVTKGVFGGGKARLEGWKPRGSRLLVEYKLSDFEISPHVGVGLAGKPDEAVFEGVVKDPESPIRGKRVVLRKLTGRRAKRWGMRALEVFPRLVRGDDRYHPSTTRLHGYISSSSSTSATNPTIEGVDVREQSNGGGEEVDDSELFLVHSYYGSYSLHQWLHTSDWLPQLEEKLAAHKEAVKRVGDDSGSGGGSEVSRKLRIVRMVLRDILIGINYLHSSGMAHTNLRLEDIHVSAADRHVKVGILGNAVDLPPPPLHKRLDPSSGSSSSGSSRSSATDMVRRKIMISQDIKCVGLMMARIVIRQLMIDSNFAKFQSFLRRGNDPATLREYMLGGGRLDDGGYGAVGLQILDRDGGAGWNFLGAMLATKPSDRIGCSDALRHPFLCGPRWRVEPSLELTRWAIGSTAARIVEEYMYLPSQRERLWKLIGALERMNGADSITTANLVRDSLLSSAQRNSRSSGGGGRSSWRLTYHTGRQIGLTNRRALPPVQMGHVMMTIGPSNDMSLSAPSSSSSHQTMLAIDVHVGFTVMPESGPWPHDKSGMKGMLRIHSECFGQEMPTPPPHRPVGVVDQASSSMTDYRSVDDGHRPSEVTNDHRDNIEEGGGYGVRPVLRFDFSVEHREEEDEEAISLELDYRGKDLNTPLRILREVQLQLPLDLFHVSRLACVTYIDSRMLVIRGLSGAALIFMKSTRNDGTGSISSTDIL